MKQREIKKLNKGITLIALVITIIVLLILAGVSIAMLTGENGILSQAQKAGEQTVVGQEKEAIALAYNGAKAENNGGDVDTDNLKRKFYITMCVNENWSVRTLRERINSALFERTAISKKPEQTIINELQLLNEEHKMSTDLFFRDPYILDFLNLKDTYSEKDLESAIIAELEKFILELGNDFAFLARQKRIIIDGEDYYIDLLFFHRKMKRLVVIELKLDKFKPEYKGQVELYLKWLNKYEKSEGENPPIAIILCADKNDTVTELLELGNSGIHVAQYLTKYVPKDILEEKLLISIKNAKIHLEQRGKNKRE